jgi:hypothetical protein
MRVQSEHPIKNGGWFHPFGSEVKKPIVIKRPEPPRVEIDCEAMMSKWAGKYGYHALANALGVSEASLSQLSSAWAPEHNAWAFPMRDGEGKTIGIRLRNMQGEKWAVKGSHQGIFLPEVQAQTTAYICEGPTDTAAALTLGFFAIGRPSCICGGEQIKVACKRLGVRQIVMVADNDAPGINGAQKVAKEIGLPWRMWIPQTKDIREFLRIGGTRQMIESDLKNYVWRKP